MPPDKAMGNLSSPTSCTPAENQKAHVVLAPCKPFKTQALPGFELMRTGSTACSSGFHLTVSFPEAVGGQVSSSFLCEMRQCPRGDSGKGVGPAPPTSSISEDGLCHTGVPRGHWIGEPRDCVRNHLLKPVLFPEYTAQETA